jgi:putative transposase
MRTRARRSKTLSENLCVKLEKRRISLRMGLQSSPFSRKEMRLMSEATTSRKVDYFQLPRPLWRKLKKSLPNKKKTPAQARRGGRRRASDRAVINGICYVLWTGCQWKAVHRDWFGVSSSVIHERFQTWTKMGIFEKLMKKMAQYYAREQRGGIGWKWQAMDSKSCSAPLGGDKTGKNPTDRGKLGAKINLMVDERGAPLSIVLTGANRHDKVSAIDLIVSMLVKRAANKEQHLCADKAYDSADIREFVASKDYIAHIKINPTRSKKNNEGQGTTGDEYASKEEDASTTSKEVYPARRWVVERTISWLGKRRGLRTRWTKKSENWLSLIQLACAHILLNLAVFG